MYPTAVDLWTGSLVTLFVFIQIFLQTSVDGDTESETPSLKSQVLHGGK